MMLRWLSRYPKPRHAAHYKRTRAEAPGAPRILELAGVYPRSSVLELEYRWRDVLPWAEADRLDTRVRAFVACAIYDAALEAGLPCGSGPKHGVRPSWLLPGEPIPWSLVAAGFSTELNACRLRVGPIMGRPGSAWMFENQGLSFGPPPPEATGRHDPSATVARLGEGFASVFPRIRV